MSRGILATLLRASKAKKCVEFAASIAHRGSDACGSAVDRAILTHGPSLLWGYARPRAARMLRLGHLNMESANPIEDLLDRWDAALDADLAINPADWLETTFYSVLGRTTPLARQKEMAFDSGRCSPYVQHSDLIAYTSYSFGNQMHKIKCPVHYIMGEDDWSTTPAMAIETSKMLAAEGVVTEVDVLLGVGHIPHWEQPEVFNALLEKVLKRFKTS